MYDLAVNFDGRLKGNSVRFIAMIVVLFGIQLADAQAPAPDAEPVQHEFVIKNFKTESVGRYAYSYKLLWRITESNR